MDDEDVTRHPLLLGVVGSTAYGLAHEGSDVDRLGMFARSTERLFGLEALKDSHVSTSPDVTWHEARKALRLIMACNPTATEILWLEGYEVRHPLGEELIGMRSMLLSAKGVRNAYLGYATQQLRKLRAREVTGTAAPSRTQSAKHARHLIRLVIQGVELHTHGDLVIRIPDPQVLRDLAEEFVADPPLAEGFLAWAESEFDKPGVLPSEPDVKEAELWLKKVRWAVLQGEL